MKDSALNRTDDEGRRGYPTARVNGLAIAVRRDDDYGPAIQALDGENGQSMECGGIYRQPSGFDSPDDMRPAADYPAYALCRVR